MSAEVSVRPAQAEELETVAELLNEHSRRIHGTDNTTVAQLQQYWESPDVEFPDDVLIAEKDGALVGYADIGVWGEHAWLDLRGLEPEPLHPLLAAIEARVAEKKPGLELIGYTEENDRFAREAFARAGYRVLRHSFRMEIDLGDPIPEPAWPEGITVRTLRDGEEKQVYDAHMESFADAWMFTPDPFDHGHIGSSTIRRRSHALVSRCGRRRACGNPDRKRFSDRAGPGLGADPGCRSCTQTTRNCSGPSPAGFG